MAYDEGEKDHKGVDHTLDQGQSHHVAVGDVAHFMPKTASASSWFIEQAGAHGH